AVGVDVESDLNLRDAARGRGNPEQVELAEQLVIARHLPLSLMDADGHRILVVRRRGKGLALLCRNGRITVDDAAEDAAQGFDAQRKGRDIQQQNVFYIPL